jgi:mono/diheme cytochrome c family protein
VLLLTLLAPGALLAHEDDPQPAEPGQESGVPAAGDVTFSRDIAPILQANCQECHRPGGTAPFSLVTYEQVKPMAPLIQAVTASRFMPPWRAAPGYGEFQNERRLAEAEIETIGRWVEAGTPEGDPKDLPPPRQFPYGWTHGTPDLVLQSPEPFRVPAAGRDIYRNFVLPFYSEEDQWVTAVDIVPDNPEVVHHVILYLDPAGTSLAKDRAQGGPGFTVFGTDAGFSPAIWMIGWTPGAAPPPLPEGTAWKIPARTYVVMQVHYHPHGTVAMDQTRVGLHFAKGPVEKRVRTAFVGNVQFRIPAGSPRYRVRADLELPRDITLLALWPHMHQLGAEMKIAARPPGGSEQPLVWVPNWDFQWQLTYVLKEPLKLPRRTRLSLDSYYDNSADNPHNPNSPPKPVGYGPQTTDEMCFCFFLYTVDAERLSEGRRVENDGLEIRF